MKKPSYDLIVAAVSGDKAAMELIMMHYHTEIEKASGGNPIIYKQIADGLREAILHYDLENPAANDAYLQATYPSQE